MYIFQLTRKIFHNNYPFVLEKLLLRDVAEKIHNYNSPEKCDFLDLNWHYNKNISPKFVTQFNVYIQIIYH
jgi:hypothetical protein